MTELSPAEYDYRESGLDRHEMFRAIHPTCARKLVEGAEAYARDLGFTPHPDYQRARQIFGDLDAGPAEHSMCLVRTANPSLCLAPMTHRPDAAELSTRSPGAVDLRGFTSRWL